MLSQFVEINIFYVVNLHIQTALLIHAINRYCTVCLYFPEEAHLF